MFVQGSPPPMRGKAVNGIVKYNTLGITPAYAGKRSYNQRRTVLLKDHPRLCGEKQKIRHHVSIVTGSPPPMRGKVQDAPYIYIYLYIRITPAYAGKSMS